MKALLGVIATTLVFGQCNDEGSAFIRETRFHLKEKEVFDAGNFELQLIGIEDSRCPKNANCVWQGAAVAHLAISAKGLQDTINTCLGGCAQLGFTHEEPDAAFFEVNSNHYKLTLEKVLPYPDASEKVQQEAKEAYYLLRKLPD